jgi:hypothetical protein
VIRNTVFDHFFAPQVTVKEATVNTLVAAEVAGWFFIGKNIKHCPASLLL